MMLGILPLAQQIAEPHAYAELKENTIQFYLLFVNKRLDPFPDPFPAYPGQVPLVKQPDGSYGPRR